MGLLSNNRGSCIECTDMLVDQEHGDVLALLGEVLEGPLDF